MISNMFDCGIPSGRSLGLQYLFYAKCDIEERRGLWDTLRQVSVKTEPWMVGGILMPFLLQRKGKVVQPLTYTQ